MTGSVPAPLGVTAFILTQLGVGAVGMFDIFSVAARRAVVRAEDEARSLGHPWAGTAHLLLGLVITMPSAQPGKEYRQHSRLVLEAVGVGHEALRRAVVQALGDHGPGSPEHRKLTSRAGSVLVNAPVVRPSGYPDGYVGTRELLLSLLDSELVDLPVQKRGKAGLRHRRILLTTPESYDIGSRLLLDAAGSLDRVRAALHDVDRKWSS